MLSLWLLGDSVRSPLVGAAEIVSLLPAVVMVAVAASLFLLRPRDTTACLIALYLTAMAILARGTLAGISSLPAFAVPASGPPERVLSPSVYVWALVLGTAPLLCAWQITKKESVSRRTALTFFSRAFVGGAAGQAAWLLLTSHGLTRVPYLDAILPRLASPYHRLLLQLLPVIMAQQAVAFWLLLRHYRRRDETHPRAFVFFFGTAAVFIALVVINDTVAQLLTYVLANAMAYMVPLTLVYALERHALFDVRIAIRRVVQYALARQVLGLMVIAPLLALAFLVGLSLNPSPHLPTSLRQVRSVMLIDGTLLCAILFGAFTLMLALRLPLLRWFDRTYFREVYDAQRALDEVGRSLLGLSDLREIARTTLEGIDAVLHPVRAYLLTEEEAGVACLAYRSRTETDSAPWPDRASFSAERLTEILPLDPAEYSRSASWLDTLPASARAFLTEAAIRLVIPLREAGRTMGALLLGEKASGLPYSPEDRDVLRAVSSQIALAIQSARLNREFLRRRTQELTTGSVGFVELVERERRLLAADLHDETLPELRALLTDLQNLEARLALETPKYHSAAGKMVEQLRQTIQNIRDIMESLRPSALEMLGLLPALENELRKAAARAHPPLVPQFRVIGDVSVENLSAFVEISVFRIGQEAINNACRHAGARTVRAQIGVEEGELRLSVEDDGVGFSLDEASHRGHGLENMQYRANLLGARLRWEATERKQGTRVELRLPL